MITRFTKDQIASFRQLGFVEVRPDEVDVDYKQFWLDLPAHPLLNNLRVMVDVQHIELWAMPHRLGGFYEPVLLNAWKYKESELIKVVNLLI